MCQKQVNQEVICYDLQTYYGWNYGIAINYKLFNEGLSSLKPNDKEDDILADWKK